MDDRTQHVIDAIDGALADDEFPDAMRWSPDPDTVDDAPAPFDGTMVWQPPQRQEVEAGILRYARSGPLRNASITVGVAVHVAPAGTPPPAVGEWTDVGRLDSAEGLTFRPSPEELAALADQLGRAVRAYREWAERAAQLVGMTLDAWQQSFLELALASQPRPLTTETEAPRQEDPRARALELRRTRNTGPSRDIVQQRRPRRLP